MSNSGPALQLIHRMGGIPLPIKVLHSLFVSILVPVYWMEYGPANFLWFSDIALLVTVPALWLESRLLASMMTLAIALPESLWIAAFLTRLLLGIRISALADYMFEPSIPLFVRVISLFHLWLPLLLLWMVHRLGYDRRAWLGQTLLAWAVLLITYALTEPSRNINWVFGPGAQPQGWMPPLLYLGLMMAFFPVCLYLPVHLLLRRWSAAA